MEVEEEEEEEEEEEAAEEESTTLMTGVVDEETKRGLQGDLITDSLRTTWTSSLSAAPAVAVAVAAAVVITVFFGLVLEEFSASCWVVEVLQISTVPSSGLDSPLSSALLLLLLLLF